MADSKSLIEVLEARIAMLEDWVQIPAIHRHGHVAPEVVPEEVVAESAPDNSDLGGDGAPPADHIGEHGE